MVFNNKFVVDESKQDVKGAVESVAGDKICKEIYVAHISKQTTRICDV